MWARGAWGQGATHHLVTSDVRKQFHPRTNWMKSVQSKQLIRLRGPARRQQRPSFGGRGLGQSLYSPSLYFPILHHRGLLDVRR